MGNPVIGNSLFALVLALLHAPPMLALLWTQRVLRRRLRLERRAEVQGVPARRESTSTLIESHQTP